MLQVTIDNGSGPQDYTHYVVHQSIQITDSINVPTLLTLTLSNIDNAFVVPKQSSYISIYSTKYQRLLYTGFITNALEVQFLGMSGKIPNFDFQQMEYTVNASSDEWLLNVKSVPFIPAFINQTMGSVLTNLANALAPGFFDTSLIQAGDPIPYFLYDPTQKWSDIAKTFADSAVFRYKAIGRQIMFAPYGDAPLGISYDDTQKDSTFDPGGLITNVLTVPPVNDAIVLGEVEPQNIHNDYFIGDGFTANFPLRHTMFNGATNLLLEDDWTEDAFNTTYWTVQDPQDTYLLAGALNAIGASGGNLGDSYLVAQNGLELGGHLVLQHGLFTFTDTNLGLVGGVYNGFPLTMGNCLAAFQPYVSATDTLIPSPSGATNLSLGAVILGQPIVASRQSSEILPYTEIPFGPPDAILATTISFSASGGPRYARLTYVFSDGSESVPSFNTNSRTVPASHVLTVRSPSNVVNEQTGVSGTGWNVYVGSTSSSLTKQNASPIAIGTAWDEPSSGLINGGALPAGSQEWSITAPITVEGQVTGKDASFYTATQIAGGVGTALSWVSASSYDAGTIASASVWLAAVSGGMPINLSIGSPGNLISQTSVSLTGSGIWQQVTVSATLPAAAQIEVQISSTEWVGNLLSVWQPQVWVAVPVPLLKTQVNHQYHPMLLKGQKCLPRSMDLQTNLMVSRHH